MSPFHCAREKEVVSQLELGQWPQASPAELRAHVAGCRSCSDLVLIAQTFTAARTASAPPLPSPGALWWRAQLRRRNQAIERISRPILGAEIFALVVALLVGAAGAGWELRHSVRWLAWLQDIPRALDFTALLPASLPGFTGSLWFLVPLLATLAVAGGIAVYFTLEKQ